MTRLLLGIISATAVGTPAGCGLFFPQLPGDKTPSAPIGSDFDTATILVLDAAGDAVLAGTISEGAPDVYDLGPCDPGDHITVTVDPASGSLLDPIAAVFNAEGEVLALNDDADLAAGLLGSHIDEIVGTGGDHYYLAVFKFFLDSLGGDYDGSIHIERGGTVPEPPAQVLLLNFAGGTVTLPSEGTLDLAPFDAADIDATYTGMTDQIQAKIEEVVRQNFRNTGLQIVTSSGSLPASCGFSAIHFGAFSATKFGIADSVDQGNRDRCDDGLVFTDDFDKPFADRPTADGIAIAIGNVAAHEAGHLLGLHHVGDVSALMDDTGTASTLLADQEFKTAPLSSTVFPIGTQNAPARLDRVVPP